MTRRRIKLVPILVLLLSLMITLSGGAAAKVSDGNIAFWVKDALRHDERVDAANITVSAKDGIVTLDGSVDNLAAKRYGDLEAKKINGVLGVVNKIAVAPRWRSDTDIRQAVRRRLLNSAVIESEGLSVISIEGEVTLAGTVATWSERAQAELLASEVRGVKAVQNAITVQWPDDRSDQEIKNDAVATLNRDVYLNGLPITVMVQDAVITLTGRVGNAYEKQRAGDEVRWIAHAKEVKNQVNVDWRGNRGVRNQTTWSSQDALKEALRQELEQDIRVNASDITLSASYGHVTLDGSVANHYQRRVAEQDAHDVVGVGWVTNNLFVRADTREDWAVRDDIAFNLDTDFILEGFDLETAVKGGVATLSGEVHTAFEKFHAREVAAEVRGVKKVMNRIAVHRSTLKSDAELTQNITERLGQNWATGLVHDDIKVRVKNRIATLTGDVQTWSERNYAGRVAFSTDGVWAVDNQLTVQGYHDYHWADWHLNGSTQDDPYIESDFDYMG